MTDRKAQSAGKHLSILQIAIVDDDAGVRRTLTETIDLLPDCRCTAEFASGEAAVAGLPRTDAGIVLMDINMPGMDGIECLRRLNAGHDAMKFIMLTVYEDTESIFQALTAGASGYLLKRSAPTELEAAIRLVEAGGSPMTSHIARKVVQAFRQPPPPADSKGPDSSRDAVDERLTQRQEEVLELLAQGLLYKEIAASLGVSYETVNNHIRQIYRKLHIRSRSQAVAKYYTSRGQP